MLVASWDDSRSAAWRNDGNDKRQVLVELYEDEVHALLDLLARGGDVILARASLRDRLKVALECLP